MLCCDVGTGQLLVAAQMAGRGGFEQEPGCFDAGIAAHLPGRVSLRLSYPA